MAANPIIGSIIENLKAITLVFEPTAEPFTKDRGNTGDSREFTVGKFVERYFPQTYVVKKGHIYNKTTNSNNIDCVILAPNHPALITPIRELIIAEGVFAAIEIKPDCTSTRERNIALDQIKSVKAVKRQTRIPKLSFLEPSPEYLKNIPGIIFANTSPNPKTFIEHLQKRVASGESTLEELPDLIITMDHGLYVISPDIRYTPFGKFYLENNPGHSQSSILHFCDADQPMSLALFLIHLLNLPGPELLMSSFILSDYLKDIEGFKICGYNLVTNSGSADEPVAAVDDQSANFSSGSEDFIPEAATEALKKKDPF